MIGFIKRFFVKEQILIKPKVASSRYSFEKLRVALKAMHSPGLLFLVVLCLVLSLVRWWLFKSKRKEEYLYLHKNENKSADKIPSNETPETRPVTPDANSPTIPVECQNHPIDLNKDRALQDISLQGSSLEESSDQLLEWNRLKSLDPEKNFTIEKSQNQPSSCLPPEAVVKNNSLNETSFKNIGGPPLKNKFKKGAPANESSVSRRAACATTIELTASKNETILKTPTRTPKTTHTLDQQTTLTLNPNTTPTLNPNTTPTLNPKTTPTLNPKTTPTLNPKTTPTLIPKTTPTLIPKTTPTLIPKTTPTLIPKTTPTLKPKTSPTLTSKTTPTLISKTALTLIPNAKPTLIPEATPTQIPKATPTQIPKATPTQIPKATPTQIPKATPTQITKATPTQIPKATPTQIPKATSTLMLKTTPTLMPKTTPTLMPKTTPTLMPKTTPTLMPTTTPTLIPTTPKTLPQETPTLIPKTTPTLIPKTTPTLIPKTTPTLIPKTTPTLIPKTTPTLLPKTTHTLLPKTTYTLLPTKTPTLLPTKTPLLPTKTPTLLPTKTPTLNPKTTPTLNPKKIPTLIPKTTLTLIPKTTLTLIPKTTLTLIPKTTLTLIPKTTLTLIPKTTPTLIPKTTLTLNPKTTPTLNPKTTRTPLSKKTRTLIPKTTPTLNPKVTPTLKPKTAPTLKPETAPTLNIKITPTLNPKTTPTLNPKTTPTLNKKTTPTLNPKTTPTLNPKTTPKMNPKTTPTLNPKTTSTLNPKTTSTLNPKTTSTLNPKTTSTLNPKTTSTLNPKTTSTLNPKTTPTLNPKTTSTLNPKTTPTQNPNTTSTPTLTTKKNLPEAWKKASVDLKKSNATSGAPKMIVKRIVKRPGGGDIGHKCSINGKSEGPPIWESESGITKAKEMLKVGKGVKYEKVDECFTVDRSVVFTHTNSRAEPKIKSKVGTGTSCGARELLPSLPGDRLEAVEKKFGDETGSPNLSAENQSGRSYVINKEMNAILSYDTHHLERALPLGIRTCDDTSENDEQPLSGSLQTDKIDYLMWNEKSEESFQFTNEINQKGLCEQLFLNDGYNFETSSCSAFMMEQNASQMTLSEECFETVITQTNHRGGFVQFNVQYATELDSSTSDDDGSVLLQTSRRLTAELFRVENSQTHRVCNVNAIEHTVMASDMSNFLEELIENLLDSDDSDESVNESSNPLCQIPMPVRNLVSKVEDEVISEILSLEDHTRQTRICDHKEGLLDVPAQHDNVAFEKKAYTEKTN